MKSKISATKGMEKQALAGEELKFEGKQFGNFCYNLYL